MGAEAATILARQYASSIAVAIYWGFILCPQIKKMKLSLFPWHTHIMKNAIYKSMFGSQVCVKVAAERIWTKMQIL